MARDAYTGPVSGNDDSDTLWLKIAVAFQDYAGVVNTGSVETWTPVPGEQHNNILRSAYALQQII